jgi:hypothetical protein
LITIDIYDNKRSRRVTETPRITELQAEEEEKIEVGIGGV